MSLDASRMKVQTNILNAFCRPTTYLERKKMGKRLANIYLDFYWKIAPECQFSNCPR